MTIEASDDPRLKELRRRIEELNRRSVQLLIFLSFGIAAAVLLWTSDLLSNLQQDVLLDAMRWWVLAILPAAIGILPLKEIRENSLAWYNFLRWLKFALLWLAIIFIVVGTAYFVYTTLLPVPPDNSQTTTMNFVPIKPLATEN